MYFIETILIGISLAMDAFAICLCQGLTTKENKEIFNTLKQYKDVVEERSIVSKATKDGIITYINEPFEKISGYKKDELLGKSHNIISHPNIDKNIFKDMWKKLKLKMSKMEQT